MKRNDLFGLFVVMFMTFVISSVAGAYTITVDDDKIDVGDLDTFLVSDNLDNSGDDTELGWVNDQDDIDTIFSYKTAFNDDNRNLWISVDDSDAIFALLLTGSPDYFLIKTGGNPNKSKKGNKNSDKNDTDHFTHYLFENIDNNSYAVINLDANFTDIGGSGQFTVSGISHITVFGGVPVPEPATMMLLGFGLLGLAGITRRSDR